MKNYNFKKLLLKNYKIFLYISKHSSSCTKEDVVNHYPKNTGEGTVNYVKNIRLVGSIFLKKYFIIF